MEKGKGLIFLPYFNPYRPNPEQSENEQIPTP